MGTPRPALRLVREGDEVRMVEIASGRDHTRAMQRYAQKRVRALRDKLRDAILTGLDGTFINGSMEHRLPNNLNVSFAGVEGDALLMGTSLVLEVQGRARDPNEGVAMAAAAAKKTEP